MLDRAVVVFVEVKSRREKGLVGGLESVSLSKKRKVIYAAMDYAQRAGLYDRPMRFDVVSLVRRGKRTLRLEHIEAAFDTSVLKS